MALLDVALINLWLFFSTSEELGRADQREGKTALYCQQMCINPDLKATHDRLTPVGLRIAKQFVPILSNNKC